ncbi:ArgR family transcriptional regulator [Thalassotalea euphylliae]|uniref:Arginine repressor n=1 Tax=Thalassotalea euphylliae TaxID=1655234 RepID=A0A3E0TV48_9GAMM|nr:ArgR family transcriptional regulator [Thalassotalea euphylliae]REL27812.1 ArgR family transcriptional regulator [Thalassotalea euphylliae]
MTQSKPTTTKQVQGKQKEEQQLLQVFKSLIKQGSYRSQEELAFALAQQGFEHVSQSKVSRMLAKLGAVKTRNSQNEICYNLPDALIIPKTKHPIETIALDLKHNNYQIVLKTGTGGAPLMARVLDSLEESIGILGTIAGDDTVLIIPEDIAQIDAISQAIIDMLDIPTRRN